MDLQTTVIETFERRYGQPPAIVVRAPGRVNLIGEHTDYNDGFVLPMAIDRAVWIALQARGDRRVALHSLDLDAHATFDLDALAHNQAHWIEYIKGVAWALQQQGYALHGWEGVIAGDVPIGAGLSSSAAVEIAAARAFLAVSGAAWDPVAMARVGQRAENVWMGVSSGIMDQMASACGRAGHALLIDCRSLESETLPLPTDVAVVILDTGTRRGLVGSAYNERRAQCEAAAAHFGARALRDVTLSEFTARAGALDALTRQRARHVISENERVLQARAALLAGDTLQFGALMDASHASLRDDFAVSTPALDAIVGAARRQPGCYGARMTGAGFGGCALALVQQAAAADLTAAVAAQYHAATGLTPNLYVCQAAAGADVVRRG